MPKKEFVGECDFCQYETSLTKYPMRRYQDRIDKPDENREKSLCIVCASTHAGGAHEYPEQYPERKMMSMLAWGINYVADVAAKKQKR